MYGQGCPFDTGNLSWEDPLVNEGNTIEASTWGAESRECLSDMTQPDYGAENEGTCVPDGNTLSTTGYRPIPQGGYQYQHQPSEEYPYYIPPVSGASVGYFDGQTYHDL
jgi:hypothetical protein